VFNSKWDPLLFSIWESSFSFVSPGVGGALQEPPNGVTAHSAESEPEEEYGSMISLALLEPMVLRVTVDGELLADMSGEDVICLRLCDAASAPPVRKTSMRKLGTAAVGEARPLPLSGLDAP
jgi:hypothetical protein